MTPETAASLAGEGGGIAEIGKPAPDLSIQSLNGKGTISNESLRGKIAIVDFWATWCGPCKESFPKLEELAKQHAGNVQIVGISVDDSKDGVLDWARAQGATFPIGWDDGHVIAKKWKVAKMPTTYILDATGTVRFVHEKYQGDEGDLIARELAFLSSEPPPAEASAVASNDTSGSPASADAPEPSSDSSSESAAPPAKPKKGAAKPAKPAKAAKPSGAKKVAQKKKKR
ncbi:MAG: TlpA family protein disulfide reductase [Labilithrix sp.]|nr:TlpA family protein disulfide reductase [Labilithrix sp.]